MRRLRLLSEELSTYERFELTAAYAPGLAAGEHTRADRRSHHPTGEDFWLFDGEWKASMRYSDVGEFLGADVAKVDPNDESARYWLAAYGNAPQKLVPRLAE